MTVVPEGVRDVSALAPEATRDPAAPAPEATRYPAAPAPEATRYPAAPAPEGGRAPYRVVIADDDPAIRGLVAAAVKKAGAVVVASVGDGAAALVAVREQRPELAILDVSMPVMSGLEACHELRAGGPSSAIPVVMLSAAVHPAAVTAGRAAGADLYLEKPFSPRALGETIRGLLAERYGP